LKQKEGNYGEDTFYKTLRNPKGKVTGYTMALKNYLANVEIKWKKAWIYPLVVFVGGDVDLGQLHSFENGMIYLADFPDYVKFRRNEKFAKFPSKWIVDGLSSLPTWDRVITRTNEPFQGFLQEKLITVDIGESKMDVVVDSIAEIDINRNGYFFEKDELNIRLFNGKVINGYSQWQSLSIKTADNAIVQHKIRNLSRVVVGLSRDLYWKRAVL
jgi:hypothetical protein